MVSCTINPARRLPCYMSDSSEEVSKYKQQTRPVDQGGYGHITSIILLSRLISCYRINYDAILVPVVPIPVFSEICPL